MKAELRTLAGWQRGSLRLITARLLLLLLCSAPAAIAVEMGIASGWSEVPRLTQRAADPTLSMILSAMASTSSIAFVVILAGLVSWLVLERLLTAIAMGTLQPCPCTPVGGHADAGLLSGFRSYGWPRLGAMLRLWAWTLLVTVFGLAVLGVLLEPSSILAERHGYSGLHRVLTLPGLGMGLSLLWVSAVGAMSSWGKAAIVIDGRRRAWRVASIAGAVLRRAPMAVAVSGLLLFVTQVMGAIVLVAYLPAQGGGALWFGWLLWQSLAWHARCRLASHVYSSARCAELRQTSDGPLTLDMMRPRGSPGAAGPTN